TVELSPMSLSRARLALGAIAAAIVLSLSATSVTANAAPAVTATDARIAPSARGVLGAWLLAGPFRAGAEKASLDVVPAGVDERHLVPWLGAVLGGERDLGRKTRPPARWIAAAGSSADPGLGGSRAVDVKAALEDAGGNDLIAYAAGRLHVE